MVMLSLFAIIASIGQPILLVMTFVGFLFWMMNYVKFLGSLEGAKKGVKLKLNLGAVLIFAVVCAAAAVIRIYVL
jgi:hypothetical protein